VKYLRQEAFIKKLGKRIKEVRIQKGISQEDLAFKAGIEYSQVSRIERGIINTSISQVFVLSQALGVEAYELFKFKA